MAFPIRIQDYGNQLLVIMDDESRYLASPTTVGLWIVNTDPTPASDNFVWPYDPSNITDEWGYREPPLPGLSDFHSGCDWPKAAMTPIKSAGDGTVYMVRDKTNGDSPGRTSWGNRVIVAHGNLGDGDLFTGYAHMNDSMFPVVSQGQYVEAGQVIGYIGMTGSATGNHLHFSTFIGGLAIGTVANPLNCVNPRYFMSLYNPGNVIAA